MSDIDLLEHEIRHADREPRGALVLHHGRGTDRFDLLPLLEALDPSRSLIGVTPQGPLQLPPGGWHWYEVPRVGYPDPATFWDTFRHLERFHDALSEQIEVPWERTIVGGFSMGAVMSHALGLNEKRPPPAGILALSGFIPTVEGFQPHFKDRTELPVAIAHGSEDPIISVDFARRDRKTIEDAGLPLLYRESRMGHAIDPEVIPLLRHWIEERFED